MTIFITSTSDITIVGFVFKISFFLYKIAQQRNRFMVYLKELGFNNIRFCTKKHIHMISPIISTYDFF